MLPAKHDVPEFPVFNYTPEVTTKRKAPKIAILESECASCNKLLKGNFCNDSTNLCTECSAPSVPRKVKPKMSNPRRNLETKLIREARRNLDEDLLTISFPLPL